MSNTSQIDQVLKSAADRKDVPGVVALAADRNGGVFYQGAFGVRNIDSGPAMTLDTVFWIASMTKAITSTAAMQLVEQGKLQLDEPLGGLLPELASPQVLEGFDADGAPQLRPAKRPITLRHLLTHTAGFSYDIWNAEIGRYMEQKGIPGIISCENAALTTPLVFDPGERWEYGINIDWVGKAVEKVSGKSLEDYLRDHIFNPLGMSETGFVIKSEQRSRLASMHARDEDGALTPIEFEIPQAPEFFMGGGGLYSVGGDYIKFTQMILHKGSFNGAQILQPETVEQMSRNQIGAIEVGPMKTAIPQHSNDVEIFPGMVKKWGLGFLINTDNVSNGRRAGSLTWAGLGNTYFWIDPQAGITGVILTQILPFVDVKVMPLYAAFESAVYSLAEAA